jgi:exopolyphosphatase/guanosine-5'-triphosphate,3'-diphosphate pyrophosphatase
VEELAAMSLSERRKLFQPQRAEIVVAGAVILEAVLKRLEVQTIQAVDQGLRDGVLVDLIRKRSPEEADTTLADAAIEFGEKLRIDTNHAKQVARLSLALFDQLASLHHLPQSSRALLEIAALLHDVGHSVNHARHHKHGYYLIRNADLPGMSEHEQELIALIARFHRRSPPETDHPDMQQLSKDERETVRKLATLLRVADSLDRGHHQNVITVRAHNTAGGVKLHLTGRSALDLEIWDTEQEAALFRRVFQKKLDLNARVRRAA